MDKQMQACRGHVQTHTDNYRHPQTMADTHTQTCMGTHRHLQTGNDTYKYRSMEAFEEAYRDRQARRHIQRYRQVWANTAQRRIST